MWDFIVGLVKTVIPPTDAHPDAQYAWRVQIAILSLVTFFCLCASVALALGLVPGIGGFARASDVAAIKEQVQSLHNEVQTDRAERIASDLLSTRILHCQANTPTAKNLYWQRISELMTRYQTITSRVYNLPACSDL